MYYNIRNKEGNTQKAEVKDMRYNRAEIMKKAWEVYKSQNFNYKKNLWSFAKCLKEAWKVAKEEVRRNSSSVEKKETSKEIKAVADWFLKKNFDQNERYVISLADMKAIKETSKAYFINAVSDFGAISFWCPKSVCC